MAAQAEDLANLRKRLLELKATIDRRIKENEELMNRIDNWKFHFENLAVKPLY
jgi:predicted nuclease with TOPRIM domain